MNDCPNAAEVQRLMLNAPGRWCEVCLSCSWSPCPEGTLDAVRDEHGWKVCDLCQALKALGLSQQRESVLEAKLAAHHPYRTPVACPACLAVSR